MLHSHSVQIKPAELPWYAVRVRSRYERVIASTLCDKGYEVFLPLYRCRRRWSDRIKELESPLFPGYLFCRFDIQTRLPVLVTPGILQIVGFGETPYPVDEMEIAAIQATVLSELQVQPWPFLHVGQRVRIEFGSLSGQEGILLALKGKYRLVVSVTLLQRSVAVEIERDWAIPIEKLPVNRSLVKAEPASARPLLQGVT